MPWLDEYHQSEPSRVVVRIKTTFWRTKRGFRASKEIYFLRNQCKGVNFLEEDLEAADVQDVASLIKDYSTKPDGVYEVLFDKVGYDWETGAMDSWTYRLVPFPPPPSEKDPAKLSRVAAAIQERWFGIETDAEQIRTSCGLSHHQTKVALEELKAKGLMRGRVEWGVPIVIRKEARPDA